MADWKGFIKNNPIDIITTTAGIGIDMASGKGVVKSVVGGAFEFLKWDIIGGIIGGPAMLANFGLQMGAMGMNLAVDAGREKTQRVARNNRGPGKIGGGFFDNQNAYTMRQRSLQAMGGHQGMVNSALGSEARRRSANINY